MGIFRSCSRTISSGIGPSPEKYLVRGNPLTASVWIACLTWATFSRIFPIRSGRMISIYKHELVLLFWESLTYKCFEISFFLECVHLEQISNVSRSNTQDLQSFHILLD